MRFAPHRTVSMTGYDGIDPGYDSLSDDDSSHHQQRFNSSDKSASGLDYTPSKTFSHGFVTKKLSDPLSDKKSQVLTSSSMVLNTNSDESLVVDQLSELLESHSIKERYESAKRSKSLGRLKVRSRPTSAASNHSNISLITADMTHSSNEEIDSEIVHQAQYNVISGIEQRTKAREQMVAKRVKEIQEEKRRIEEERRRKEEEERKRLEEEKKRKEEEERKRKEEEGRLKKEEEEKAKLEALKKKQEEEKRAAEKKAEEEAALRKKKEQDELDAKMGEGQTNFSAIEKEFVKYKNEIQIIKTEIVERVKSTPDLKKLIMQYKRKINPKFGQLTNSVSQLSRISSELVQLIGNTKGNEIAYKWILNFTAKAIVSQAETEVRVKPASSLPLANLALNLICEFPELFELLKARFIKKCPFVIGYTCQINTEEGRLRMGWKRNEDKKWEDEITYDERMAGMMTLYSVMTRLPLNQPHFNNKQHPLPMSENWKLIARILNTPLELITNAHFIVVNAWWDASALQFTHSYGNQGLKVLRLIYGGWCDAVMNLNQANGGSIFAGLKTLKTIGEEWVDRGTLKEFEAMEY